MSTPSLAHRAPRGTRPASDARQHVVAVYRLAAAAATLTVAMGAVNQATGSGFACTTWPGCYPGHFGPEAEVHAWIEFSHRVVAALTTPLLLAAAIMGRRLPRALRPARDLPWVAVFGAVVSAVLGMVTVLNLGLAMPLSVFDLLSAMLCLVAMTVATLSLERSHGRWSWTPLARLAAGAVTGTMVMHLLGIVVAGPSSFTAVMGWPLWELNPGDHHRPLQFVRIALAVAMLVALLVVARLAWRREDTRPVAVALVATLLVEAASIALIERFGVDLWFAGVYAAAAAVVLFCGTLVAGIAGLSRN